MNAVVLVVLVVVGLLVVLCLAGLFLGLSGGLLWLGTLVHHALKPEQPPGRADRDWDRSQGREAR